MAVGVVEESCLAVCLASDDDLDYVKVDAPCQMPEANRTLEIRSSKASRCNSWETVTTQAMRLN